MADESGFRAALRSFATTFPPLKLVLYINDIICYLFGQLVDLIKYLITQVLQLNVYIFKIVFGLVQKGSSWLLRQLLRFEFVRKITTSRPYQQLRIIDPGGPIPYANNLIKRLFTYHGGLLLALALYVFIYFVLVHNHTLTSVSIAVVLLLIYLVLIENSHTIRSILMLCLPIMFTNRGRALVYCSMLAIMARGPIRTLKQNVREIHTSLTCCKQYLIVSGDRQVEENYVKRLAKAEEVVLDLVDNIRQYAQEIKEEFAEIIRLAVACEQYIIQSIEVLKNIVNICNEHSQETIEHCHLQAQSVRRQCELMFDPFRFSLCDLPGDLGDVCRSVRAPAKLCELPAAVIDYIDRTIGQQLKQYIRVIENEFYVNIDIHRNYSYNLTKSKNYTQVADEIKFDVEQKFWYVHLIGRLFHLITLALVVFILATAAFYHMHYRTELAYDNMYLDDKLLEVEASRQVRAKLREQRRSGRPNSNEQAGRDLNLISIEDEHQESRSVRSVDTDTSEGRNVTPRDTSRQSADNDLDDLDTEQRSIIDQFDPLADQENDSIEALPGARLDNATPTNEPTEANDADQTVVDNLGLIAEQELGLNPQAAAAAAPDGHATGARPQGVPSLFPLTERHERHYLRPSSLTMNHVERSKLKWSSIVWIIIVAYIWFFVLLDYSFYWLIRFLVDTLREILFTSDLPLVDLETKSRTSNGTDTIVRYNRTYLSALRKQKLDQFKLPNGTSMLPTLRRSNASLAPRQSHTNSSIQAFYRRLMDSIERDIPDDVAILESLEECLPVPQVPNYGDYRTLLILALFTFVAVIVEAYALRTRHCIADLYYPDWAQTRATWLYNRIRAEKARFEEDPDDEDIVAFESRGRGEEEAEKASMELS